MDKTQVDDIMARTDPLYKAAKSMLAYDKDSEVLGEFKDTA